MTVWRYRNQLWKLSLPHAHNIDLWKEKKLYSVTLSIYYVGADSDLKINIEALKQILRFVFWFYKFACGLFIS